jgi:hypothetical protein
MNRILSVSLRKEMGAWGCWAVADHRVVDVVAESA